MQLTQVQAEAETSLQILQAIGQGDFGIAADEAKPRVMNISMYCYKSFAVRGFHALARECGVEVVSVFFKETGDNNHKQVTPAETALLLELIRDFAPEVITFSVMACYVPATREVVSAIKAATDAPIVIGGKFPTISPTDALEFANFACKGEGELPFITICERLRAGRDLTDIQGLWYLDTDGNPVDMGQARLFEDIDDIPFQSVGEPGLYFIEDDQITTEDPELQNPQIWVMAGRGCVYLCSYCVNSLLIPMNRGNGRFIRMRSPDSIIDEIVALREKQPNARAVSFNDEVFGVFDDWTEEFCRKYKERVGLPFLCELIPKLIKPHNIELLADAGLTELHFGIQSGSDDIRNVVLKRPGNNAEMIEKAEMLVRYGVKPEYDLILGNPFDTVEVMEETIDLLLALPRPMFLDTFKLSYFPYYPLTMRALEAGHISEQDVTYEAIADAVMYNYFFIPKVSSDRKDTLEAAIYLLSWDSVITRALVAATRKGRIPLVGSIVGLLAVMRYQQTFGRNRTLNNLRRLYLGMQMVFRGDLKLLFSKVQNVLLRPT
jgi:radical SAM superfamily enzyme YgiQ (UPF0313 family)